MPRRITLVALAIAVSAAGCEAADDVQRKQLPQAAPASPTAQSGERAVARRLDGLFGARLHRSALRKALTGIRPAVPLPGGWWTLAIDVGARRLTISDPEAGRFEQRIIAVDASHIELAPDTGCEQRGAARTQPARLAWFRSGPYLRLTAVNVPCLTDEVLLTIAAWRKA